MQALLLSPLIIGSLYLLASLGGSDAECCTTMAYVKFTVPNGNCGSFNAKQTPEGCSATICGDGTVLAGTFCGRGPCNIFGCDCEGGCRHGEFGPSFLARNRGHDIILMESEIVNQGPRSTMWTTVTTTVWDKFKLW